MKLYLDDERKCPDFWRLTKTAGQCINALVIHNGYEWSSKNKDQYITHLSLDHDLGTDMTGYDVLLWIEQRLFDEKYQGYFKIPEITIHTANISARTKMELCLNKIKEKGNVFTA